MRAEKFFYILHILTAVLIPFFVVSHLFVMHTPFVFVYEIYPSSPVAACIFVSSMVYHGLYGIRSWIVEKLGYVRKVDAGFLVAGILLMVLLNGSILGYW
ncbi:hypothetical protein [Desulfurobacterium atlanticum]|uniref:Succinate dehydrogenase subunit C n=1 Tax=Desulfurobacterium atlanticum TaxID=240169 RepID=A0A238YPX8_9BACT|nr:hypothetical protein [Desulfurobacterium atlanticum]SNR73197.1 hypothetical protein SAMN06265340_10499 [Desulfurobacterium atlanticum]